jgi:RNA polymerase sigma-70 factor (ECF subfamily)
VREPIDSLQPPDDFTRSRLEAELGAERAWLGRLARGLGFSGADAEDLAQAVAATFLELIPRFEGRSSVRTFLFGIMRRKAAEMRRSARRIDRNEDALDGSGPSLDPEAELANAELGHVINECIEQLPHKQRDAARLRFQQEHVTDDIGRALGVSPNYFGVLINRARAHLRNCIAGHL